MNDYDEGFIRVKRSPTSFFWLFSSAGTWLHQVYPLFIISGVITFPIRSNYGENFDLGHQIADLQACLREENSYHYRLT